MNFPGYLSVPLLSTPLLIFCKCACDLILRSVQICLPACAVYKKVLNNFKHIGINGVRTTVDVLALVDTICFARVILVIRSTIRGFFLSTFYLPVIAYVKYITALWLVIDITFL